MCFASARFGLFDSLKRHIQMVKAYAYELIDITEQVFQVHGDGPWRSECGNQGT